MKHFFEQLWELMLRNAALIITMIMGVSVKIMLDSRAKKLTWKQIAVKMAIAVFCGYVTYRFLQSNGLSKFESWAPSLATLVGESVIVWFMTNTPKLLASWLKVKKKDEDVF